MQFPQDHQRLQQSHSRYESNPFLNSAHHPQPSRSFQMLPSPMQLFSSVTTVQVEHPPPEAHIEHQEEEDGRGEQPKHVEQHPGGVAHPPSSLMHPKEAIYTRTTSAKKISTNEFKVIVCLPNRPKIRKRLLGPEAFHFNFYVEANIF